MVQKFGLARLAMGEGVLDVAGGKGELAFELLNLNGIPSCVVDPRPTALRKFVSKYEFGIFHRNPALAKWNTAKRQRRALLPRHLRIMFDQCLFDQLDEEASPLRKDWLEEAQLLAERSCWGAKGLATSHEEQALDEQRAEEEEELEWACCCCCRAPDEEALAAEDEPQPVRLSEAAEVERAVRGCSAVVGMHPDQAAGPIVDWALKMNVPFAVVPCCVYAKQFPGRVLPDGQPVRSYEQLVDYLVAKHPAVRCDTLEFEGRNQVVWWDPVLEHQAAAAEAPTEPQVVSPILVAVAKELLLGNQTQEMCGSVQMEIESWLQQPQ